MKIDQLLARQGVAVPYRTLHRFAVQRFGFGTGRGTTVRVADGEPGVECQLDFAPMGLLLDPETGRRRKVHALIFTAVLSRQRAAEDNLTPVVPKADALTPRFSQGPTPASHPAGDPPIRATFPSTRPATRCATSPA